jgi:hypothetical protein
MVISAKHLFWMACVTFQMTESLLLIYENFTGFHESWDLDMQGETARVNFHKDQGHLSTNVTYCPELPTPCYRAELKVRNSLRSKMFPSNAQELWLGGTFRIPALWSWNHSESLITSYLMQIHGGDNLGRSPVLGIRNRGAKMEASICGNNAFSSTSTICSYHNLGRVNFGEWENWIIHDKFSYDSNDKGFVEIWRNDSLVLNISGILTSYNDSAPHYLKIGTYVLQWKTTPSSYPNDLINWIGVDYKRVVVADQDSSLLFMQHRMLDIGPEAPTSPPTTRHVLMNTSLFDWSLFSPASLSDMVSFVSNGEKQLGTSHCQVLANPSRGTWQQRRRGITAHQGVVFMDQSSAVLNGVGKMVSPFKDLNTSSTYVTIHFGRNASLNPFQWTQRLGENTAIMQFPSIPAYEHNIIHKKKKFDVMWQLRIQAANMKDGDGAPFDLSPGKGYFLEMQMTASDGGMASEPLMCIRVDASFDIV